MRFIGQDDDHIDVRVSVDELVLLRRTLHEMCHNMRLTESDFQTILGVQRIEADALLRRMSGILDRLKLLPDLE